MASGPGRRYQGQQPQDAWSDSRRLSPPALPPQWRQPGFSPSGPQAGPALGAWPPPSLRPPRQRLRRRSVVLLALAGLVVIGLVVSVLGSGGGSPSATTAADRSAASADLPAKVVREELACAERPPGSGRIYVRTVTPGGSPQVKRLSGDRRWDSASGQCLTSLQLALAAAAPGAGYCTQVGYVVDNPGYDLKATPAPPLTHVAAHAGPACRAKSARTAIATQVAPAASPPPAPAHTHSAPVHSAPAHTPPAPTAPAYTPPAASAPAPPPSTAAAPAACTPLTNGGNCYEPGEYCRDSDHGVSGIAGDGEAITCADNDGWRWSPA